MCELSTGHLFSLSQALRKWKHATRREAHSSSSVHRRRRWWREAALTDIAAARRWTVSAAPYRLTLYWKMQQTYHLIIIFPVFMGFCGSVGNATDYDAVVVSSSMPTISAGCFSGYLPARGATCPLGERIKVAWKGTGPLL